MKESPHDFDDFVLLKTKKTISVFLMTSYETLHFKRKVYGMIPSNHSISHKHPGKVKNAILQRWITNTGKAYMATWVSTVILYSLTLISFTCKRDKILFRIFNYNFAVTKFTPFCCTEDKHKSEASFRRFWFVSVFPTSLELAWRILLQSKYI